MHIIFEFYSQESNDTMKEKEECSGLPNITLHIAKYFGVSKVIEILKVRQADNKQLENIKMKSPNRVIFNKLMNGPTFGQKPFYKRVVTISNKD